jgi:hypothetical protein
MTKRSITIKRPRLRLGKRRGEHYRPWLEALEDRALPSVSMTNVPQWDDAGPGPISDNAQNDSASAAWPLGANGRSIQAQVGAVQSIAVEPVKASDNSTHYIVYAGTVNGGVWRAGFVASDGNWVGDITPDMLTVVQPPGIGPYLLGNPTQIQWRAMSDSQPSLAISSLALDPNDSSGNTLWAGTGSLSSGGGAGGPAIGLLKTTDGGFTWTNLAAQGAQGLAGQHIMSIAPTTDPVARAQVVLVATIEKGILRSSDGGQTFLSVNVVNSNGMPLRDKNGNPVTLTEGSGNNTANAYLIADPNNSQRFYAATQGYDGTYNSGVFESDDAGKTWYEIDQGKAPMIAAGTNMRLAANFDGTQTNLFVVTADGSGNLTDAFEGNVLPGSRAGVGKWNDVGTNIPTIWGINGTGNFAAAADATQTGVQNGVFYVGTFQSGVLRVDRSGNWTSLDKSLSGGRALNNTFIHDDQRDIAFLGTSLLVANDGGIYGLENPTQAGSSGYLGRWVSLNSNLRDTELYNAQFDPRNGDIFGGAQDNGTPLSHVRFGVRSWTLEPGGNSDGAATAMGWDHQYYSRGNFGDYYYDGTVIPSPPDGSNGWITNFVIGAIRLGPIGASPRLPGQLMLESNGGNLYEITIVAGGGVTMMNVTPSGMTGQVRDIAYGVNNANAAYFGTSTGQIWYRSKSGASFGSQPANIGADVVEIVVDPYDSQTAYALDANGVVWQTSNATNWNPTLTGDLSGLGGPPDSNGNPTPFVGDTLALCDPNPTRAGQGALIVGGVGGAYSLRLASPNAGWQTVGQGLATVLVTDVHYVQAFDLLVVGTFGRGAWILENASPTLLTPALAAITVTDEDATQNRIVIGSVPGNSAALEIIVNNRVEYAGPASNVASITVQEGNANDTVDIEDNVATPITVKMGLGTDTVDIAKNSQVYKVQQADVTVHGRAGFADTLNGYDQKDPVGTDWTVSDSSIAPSWFGAAAIRFDNLSSINLYGGDDASYTISGTSGSPLGTTIVGGGGKNAFNVQATEAPLTINSNGSQDAVYVSESVIALRNLMGLVTINGDGHTSFTLDDSAVQRAVSREFFETVTYQPGPVAYVLNRPPIAEGDLALTRTGKTLVIDPFSTFVDTSQATFYFNNLTGLTIKDGSEVDDVHDGSLPMHTFALTDTGGIRTTTLDVTSKDAQITLGDANNSLDQIGTLILDATGSPGGVTAVLDDEAVNRTIDDEGTYYTFQSNAGLPSYTITSQTVHRLNEGTETVIFNGSPLGQIPVGPYSMDLTYYNLKSLNLTGGQTGNNFTVQSKLASTDLGITAGSGGDTITLGDTSHSLDDINSVDATHGTVNITGSTGTQLILDDEATHNAIASDFDNGGFDTDIYQNHPLYTITYQGIQRNNTFSDTQEFVSHGTTTVLGTVTTIFSTSVTYSKLASLELDGANLLLTNDNGVNELLPQYSTSNTVNIPNNRSGPLVAGVPITVKAGDGGDRIQAGDANNSLDNIDILSVIGNTGTKLVLDDEANQTVTSRQSALFGEPIDYTQPTFVVAGTTVSRVNDVTQTDNQSYPDYTTVLNVQYQNPAALTIIGGRVTRTATGDKTGNIFDVESVQAGENVTVQAGAGGDQVNIGSDPVNLPLSTLDAIQGAVTVTGQGSNTTLNVNDGGTSSHEWYDVSASQVLRFPWTFGQPLGNPTQTINYSNVKYLNVYGGSGRSGGVQDVVAVRSTLASTALTSLYGGTGPNEFVVFNGSQTLDDIKGSVALHGGSSGDFAVISDQLNTVGHNYTLTAGRVQRDSMADITYDGLGEVIVATADNPYSGHSPSTVNVQSTFNGLTGVEVGNKDTVTVGSGAGAQPAIPSTTAGIVGQLGIVVPYAGDKPTVTIDDSGDTNPKQLDLSSDSSSDYLVNGLGGTSQNPGLIYFRLEPVTPVSILTGAGGDSFRIHDLTSAPALTLEGGGGTNTLQAADTANTWQVSGANSGTLNGTVKFVSLQNLTGGSSSDVFNFQTGGSLAGKLDGGGGTNTLDYSAYVGEIVVDLPKAVATGAGNGIANIRNVNGSIGNDLIVGDDNPNVLRGGTGRNIIIGGKGADTLTGGGGINLENILIGGTTLYDQDLTALNAIFAEWKSSDLLSTRMGDIAGRTTNGLNLNGSYVLVPVATRKHAATVFDDAAVDQLFDGAGMSWFFVHEPDDKINNGAGPLVTGDLKAPIRP